MIAAMTKTALLLLLLCTGAVNSLNVIWGDCCGGVRIVGELFPIEVGKSKQCETIVFNPGGLCRIACPGVLHDLFLFPDLVSYVSFDVSEVEQLANASSAVIAGGSEFSDPDFKVKGGVKTNISYYGNRGGENGVAAKKIAIKTVPDLIERYVGYRCGGGDMIISKRFAGTNAMRNDAEKSARAQKDVLHMSTTTGLGAGRGALQGE